MTLRIISKATQEVLKVCADWETRVALGQSPDIQTFLRFGRNPATSTTEEDVWEVGGLQTLVTAGVTMYASCEDNTNGIGQIIHIDGLDENWDFQRGNVTLNGNAQVAITARDGSAQLWTRIHTVFQISAEPDSVGNVWIAETDDLTAGVPDTGTKVHGFVNYTQAAQQTQQVMVTVPRNYVGVMFEFAASMLAAQGAARSAEVGLETQSLARDATTASPSWTPWRRQYSIALNNVATTEFLKSFRIPLVFPELTNISARVTSSAVSDVFASFDMIMIPSPGQVA